MPQPDRAPAVGRLRVADGVDQVRFNRTLQVENGPMSFKEFDTVVMKADMPSHVAKRAAMLEPWFTSIRQMPLKWNS